LKRRKEKAVWGKKRKGNGRKIGEEKRKVYRKSHRPSVRRKEKRKGPRGEERIFFFKKKKKRKDRQEKGRELRNVST